MKDPNTTYRLTAGLNTLESTVDEKGGNRQEEDDIRSKTEKVLGRGRLVEKNRELHKNTVQHEKQDMLS